MKKLIQAIENDKNALLAVFIKDLNKEVKTIQDALSHWIYTDLIPKGKSVSGMTVKELKAYLIDRKLKKTQKSIEKQAEAIKLVMEAGKLIEIKISVEWKKSRMWGANPNAEAWIVFENNAGQRDSQYVQSGSIGGCGYDKLSTAVANCLNQSNEVLKLLYQVKNKNIDIQNRELLGYGSGYGVLPHFEGGVGVSCYPAIFNKIGFEFKSVASGKTYDVFTIAKLNKKGK